MFMCMNQKIQILPGQSDYFYLPWYIFYKSHVFVDNGHWSNDMNHLQGSGCGCACVCKWACHHIYDATLREAIYLICLITDSFDVGFSPSSWYSVNYLAIVHIIASNFSPSSLIWLLPSKNHRVTKTFKTSDITGWRWCRCFDRNSKWVDRNAFMIPCTLSLSHSCHVWGTGVLQYNTKIWDWSVTWQPVWCMRKKATHSEKDSAIIFPKIKSTCAPTSMEE